MNAEPQKRRMVPFSPLDHARLAFNAVKRLLREREQLLQRLERQSQPIDQSEVAKVLQEALDNKSGWRQRARHALGTVGYAECEEPRCGVLFELGGKLKKNCQKHAGVVRSVRKYDEA